MSNVYLTFGGRAYDETTRLIVERAPCFGADRVIVADDRWLLTTPFYQQNKWLWDVQPRYFNHGKWVEQPVRFGFGWCAWKPFVIRYVLEQLAPGDVLLYTDADTFPIRDLTPIFDHARQYGAMLFEEQGCTNGEWTRPECLLAMECDKPEHKAATMACGRFQLFAKDDRASTRLLLEQWEKYSTCRNCQTWDGTKLNRPEFRRHSCEQSVLSNLAYIFGIPLHRTPDQNGGALVGVPGHVDRDWDLYPQLFTQRYCSGNRDDVSGSRLANIQSL